VFHHGIWIDLADGAKLFLAFKFAFIFVFEFILGFPENVPKKVFTLSEDAAEKVFAFSENASEKVFTFQLVF
jgi:hypothetical protein